MRHPVYLVLVMAFGSVSVGKAEPPYTITNLGTLGGTSFQAAAINDLGQIVGQALAADGYWHAILYSDGVMTDIHPSGWRQSYASDINNLGQVVGSGDKPASYRPTAFLFSGGGSHRDA